jgi:hypothetical protein
MAVDNRLVCDLEDMTQNDRQNHRNVPTICSP